MPMMKVMLNGNFSIFKTLKPLYLQMNFISYNHMNIALQDYSTENMNEGQQRFLQHLREFGLVYQRKVKFVCNYFRYIEIYVIR